jgi:peroxiredoxin
LDADIQRNTEAQAALKRDILDDVPTARDKKAKQALEDYRLLISKQKELADKIAEIQSRKKSRWSSAKNAHIIDKDGKIKPVGNSKNKEHNQLFKLQNEI